MRLSFIPFLVAVAGVIALPAPKMGLDPRADVEGKIEVREPHESGKIVLIDGLL